MNIIKAYVGDAITVYRDVTKQKDLENMVTKTKESFEEKKDVLVNVAFDFAKEQARVNVANATPLNREYTAEKFTDLVAYLAEYESSFMTSNNVDINKGLAFS